MRTVLVAILLVAVAGCQGVQTVVVVEPHGGRAPTVRVEFRGEVP